MEYTDIKFWAKLSNFTKLPVYTATTSAWESVSSQVQQHRILTVFNIFQGQPKIYYIFKIFNESEYVSIC